MVKIGLTISKPSYIAGELVIGTIKLDFTDNHLFDALVLKVVGKEKVKFTRVRHETQDGVTTPRRDQVELDKEFFNQKLVIFGTTQAYAGGPEGFTYPFEYQLPDELPSAFQISDYSQGDIENLSAEINYKLKATLKLTQSFGSDPKADCNLVVHERNFLERVASEDSTTQDVKFLRCFSRGKCEFAVAMDKGEYFPGETAQIQCNINNNSTAEITPMRCNLYQDITVQLAKGVPYRTFTKQMCEKEYPRVPPGSSLAQSLPLALVPTCSDLLHPSTEGELIACAYRIDIECGIPWGPDVHLHLPVNIIASELSKPGASWMLDPAVGEPTVDEPDVVDPAAAVLEPVIEPAVFELADGEHCSPAPRFRHRSQTSS